MMYEKFLSVIDMNADAAFSVSDAVWNYAETAFGEHKSARFLAAKLEEAGFNVTRGIAGIPTAFKATYGEGHPMIGIQAEYDALSGMSQVANITEEKIQPGMANGHGCGHNLFAGGSFAAALAVKEYIKDNGKGSVTFFGCPGEEGGGGKVFMVRAGVYSGIDAVVSWHPERIYMVRTRPSLANNSVRYTFTGIGAHAGSSPHKGRSALDAAELMNVGANFLREHMDLSSRIHYAFNDSGGTAPNIVQSHATVTYLIRAKDNAAVRELTERVDRIAQGAALMTDTQVTRRISSAYSNLITIPALQQTVYEAMLDVPLPVPTEEDLAFAHALQSTMQLTEEQKSEPIYQSAVLPPAPPVPHGGSTDTADVSWNCPTVQIHIGNWCAGTTGHSWQVVSQGKSHYAKMSMLYAGKVLTSTAIRLIENPERLAQAKKEHKERTGPAGYVCPLPNDVMPDIQPEPAD